MKVWTLPQDESLAALGAAARMTVEQVISSLEQGNDPSSLEELCAHVNAASERLNGYVEATAEKYLSEGRMVGVIGGEHSVPLGLIKAFINSVSAGSIRNRAVMKIKIDIKNIDSLNVAIAGSIFMYRFKD